MMGDNERGKGGLLENGSSETREQKQMTVEEKREEIRRVKAEFQGLEDEVNSWTDSYYGASDKAKRVMLTELLQPHTLVMPGWLGRAQKLKGEYISLVEADPVDPELSTRWNLMRTTRSRIRTNGKPIEAQDNELKKIGIPTRGESMVKTDRFDSLIRYLDSILNAMEINAAPRFAELHNLQVAVEERRGLRTTGGSYVKKRDLN
jgi:hypothetical protein